jgi:hypothetical protein
MELCRGSRPRRLLQPSLDGRYRPRPTHGRLPRPTRRTWDPRQVDARSGSHDPGFGGPGEVRGGRVKGHRRRAGGDRDGDRPDRAPYPAGRGERSGAFLQQRPPVRGSCIGGCSRQPDELRCHCSVRTRGRSGGGRRGRRHDKDQCTAEQGGQQSEQNQAGNTRCPIPAVIIHGSCHLPRPTGHSDYSQPVHRRRSAPPAASPHSEGQLRGDSYPGPAGEGVQYRAIRPARPRGRDPWPEAARVPCGRLISSRSGAMLRGTIASIALDARRAASLSFTGPPRFGLGTGGLPPAGFRTNDGATRGLGRSSPAVEDGSLRIAHQQVEHSCAVRARLRGDDAGHV